MCPFEEEGWSKIIFVECEKFLCIKVDVARHRSPHPDTCVVGHTVYDNLHYAEYSRWIGSCNKKILMIGRKTRALKLTFPMISIDAMQSSPDRN